MQSRRWWYPLAALLLAAAVLTGCGVNQAAQAQPDTQTDDVLPEPPPMPTSVPRPTPTTPPAPEAAPGIAAANALFSANFDAQTDLSNWTVVDAADVIQFPSKWEVADGRLKQVSDGEGLPGMYATALVTGQPDWKNYVVSAAAYPTNNDEIGLVFHASDQGYYVFRVLPATAGAEKYVLSRYDAKAVDFTDVAKANGAGFENGRWYRLSVTIQGSTIRAFVDDQQVLEASDAALPQGKAGVYGYAQGGLQFDNFTVQALPDSQ